MMKLQNKLANLQEYIRNGEMNRIKYSMKKHLYSLLYQSTNGINVVKEDWDILLVLDACRYDYFKNVYGKFLKGDLEKIDSKGSKTSEWLEKNFTGKYDDIIYISANPQTHVVGIENKFFETERLYNKKWDEEYKTVLPEDVVNKTLEIKKEYPDKRIISHFLQPHAPYIGDKKIRNDQGEIIEAKDMWDEIRFRNEKVSKKKLTKCYQKNLEMVLKSITKLGKINEKVVITSDHGELFGEYGLWEHPKNVHVPELIEVPWFEVEDINKDISDHNFDIGDKTGQNVESESEEEIKKKLEALGYKT